MLELNQKTFKALTRTFWAAVVLTTVTWAGSIVHRIIESRKERETSVRTLETAPSGTTIPVPAETR